jgi:hypothetical protein
MLHCTRSSTEKTVAPPYFSRENKRPRSRVPYANKDAIMPYSHFNTSGNFGTGYETDAQVLHAANHLVEVYLVYLREHETGSDVFDTRELPASKDALINAFRVVIATESRPGVRALLTRAGMTLAQFQEDVGPRMSVTPLPRKGSSYDRHWKPDPGQIRKFDRTLLRLGEERARLTLVFQQAAQLAEQKPTHHA